MRAADLVPGIVSLGIAQIHPASFHLAPRGLPSLDRPAAAAGGPHLLRGRARPGRRGRGGGGAAAGGVLVRGRSGGITAVLEVDFLAELEAVEGLERGRRRGPGLRRPRARTHVHEPRGSLVPIHRSFLGRRRRHQFAVVSVRLRSRERERERGMRKWVGGGGGGGGGGRGGFLRVMKSGETTVAHASHLV